MPLACSVLEGLAGKAPTKGSSVEQGGKGRTPHQESVQADSTALPRSSCRASRSAANRATGHALHRVS